MKTQETNVLGVKVTGINTSTTLDIIDEWIKNREKCHYITVTGVHGIMESQRDQQIRNMHNQADLVVPDGMPLVWLSRLHGCKEVSRVYGPDLMLAVCEHATPRKYRHFLYGGDSGVADLLAKKLNQKFPGIDIVGTFTPPFRKMTEEEDQLLVDTMAQSAPEIVWVGLSTPKQERWMSEHVNKLHVPVLIGVGAAFDFHTGRKNQAPGWMQRYGLEWLFRLFSEPGRLWKRYLINNPLFIMLIFMQWLGLKKYGVE